MTGTRAELVAYRIDRARATLDDARLLADQERWASCANRLYYACFYAVSALLLRRDLRSTKHSGTRSLFNRHLVMTGEVSRELGKTFNDLYELRQEGDYVDLLWVDEREVRPRVADAESFVEAVGSLASAMPEDTRAGAAGIGMPSRVAGDPAAIRQLENLGCRGRRARQPAGRIRAPGGTIEAGLSGGDAMRCVAVRCVAMRGSTIGGSKT